MRRSFFRALLLIVPLAVAASGCGSSDSTTTITTPTPVETTEGFGGTISQGGEALFAVSAKIGTVVMTMEAIGPDPSRTIGMSIGVLNSLGACTAFMDNPTATVHSSLSGVTTGFTTLCIRIYDAGTVLVDEPLSYNLTLKYTK
jgi:hypothetical protein